MEGSRKGREDDGREGRERGWRSEGDRGNGRDGTRHGMGKGKEEGERKGGEGLQPPNFNSWRRHCSDPLRRYQIPRGTRSEEHTSELQSR